MKPEEEIVFYDGMSDEELEKLLSVSIDEDAPAPKAELTLDDSLALDTDSDSKSDALVYDGMSDEELENLLSVSVKEDAPAPQVESSANDTLSVEEAINLEVAQMLKEAEPEPKPEDTPSQTHITEHFNEAMAHHLKNHTTTQIEDFELPNDQTVDLSDIELDLPEEIATEPDPQMATQILDIHKIESPTPQSPTAENKTDDKPKESKATITIVVNSTKHPAPPKDPEPETSEQTTATTQIATEEAETTTDSTPAQAEPNTIHSIEHSIKTETNQVEIDSSTNDTATNPIPEPLENEAIPSPADQIDLTDPQILDVKDDLTGQIFDQIEQADQTDSSVQPNNQADSILEAHATEQPQAHDFADQSEQRDQENTNQEQEVVSDHQDFADQINPADSVEIADETMDITDEWQNLQQAIDRLEQSVLAQLAQFDQLSQQSAQIMQSLNHMDAALHSKSQQQMYQLRKKILKVQQKLAGLPIDLTLVAEAIQADLHHSKKG